MTDERFTLVDDDFISRIKDNGVSMTAKEIVECLNTLYDENEQIKQDKNDLIDFIKKEFPKSHKHILEGFE